MAKVSIEEVEEYLSGATAMELVELRKKLEEKWDVSAAAPMGMMPAMVAGAGAQAAATEEKTEFDVVLKDVGDKKIQVIKVVRAITGLGLKEAKELVESAPKAIKEGVAKEEADDFKKQIEEVGATVEIQ